MFDTSKVPKRSQDHGSDKPFKDFLQSRLKNGAKTVVASIAPAVENDRGIQSFSTEHISQWLETHDRVLVAIQKNLGKASDGMSDADAKIKELQGLKGHVESTDSSIESLKFENKGIVATQSLFSQDLARLGPRLDDVATEMDSLSLEVHQSADDLSLLKKGTKRKFEDVNQLLSDLEGRLEGSDESLLKLEDKVQTLTLTVESLTQSNAKRSKKELATSAAVGAITGVLVVAGMVFAPEWS